jgi:phosphatidate cytidylyltransferase
LNELTKRILIAVPAAALLLWLTWTGGVPFKVLFAVVTAITIWEVHRMLKELKSSDFIIVSILLASGIWLFSDYVLSVYFLIPLLLLCISLALLYGRKRGIAENPFFSTLFNGVYAPLGFLMISEIRFPGMGEEGFWLILSFFLMIWGNDVFAYFGGKSFGKHPMAPEISPKKTWEGFFSGFVGAIAGFSIAYFIAGDFPLSYWVSVPAVIIVSVFGPLGDVTASSLKRIAGVKDSSALLPGHGGFFDRFDSMILTAPFIYLLFFYLITSGM